MQSSAENKNAQPQPTISYEETMEARRAEPPQRVSVGIDALREEELAYADMPCTD